jgi:hypothetical protein
MDPSKLSANFQKGKNYWTLQYLKSAEVVSPIQFGNEMVQTCKNN